MTSIIRLIPVVAGLVLLLHVTPSWGQPVCVAPGCNPTTSDANNNTAGGTGALANIDGSPTGAFSNTATGNAALSSNTTGNNNTATGEEALESNSTGNNNTASGFEALVDNDTGNNNTATGFQALFSNVSGANNTAVGFKALKKSLGTKNIGIGYQAGVTLTTGNNNIYLGNVGNGDESQTIRIGTAQTSAFFAGIATTTIMDGVTVVVDPITGQLGHNVLLSSARYKRDIAAMGTHSEGMLRLHPVTFAYRNDAQGVTHYGLIAEEVATVYPDLVTHTATGEVQGVRYQELIPMLLNELQRQRQELAELRALVGHGRGAQALIPSTTVAVPQ